VNHFIKEKELCFQDIEKLIEQVSCLLTSRKPAYKPTGWKVFSPRSLTPCMKLHEIRCHLHEVSSSVKLAASAVSGGVET
jgi:hypothetical protein